MAHPHPVPVLLQPMDAYPTKQPFILCFDGEEKVKDQIRIILSDPEMRVDTFCKKSVERACRWLLSTLQKNHGGQNIEASPASIHYGDGLLTRVYVRNVNVGGGPKEGYKREQFSFSMNIFLKVEDDEFVKMTPSDFILDHVTTRNSSEEGMCASAKIALDNEPWVDHSLHSCFTESDDPANETNLLLIVKDGKLSKVVVDPTEKDMEEFDISPSLVENNGKVTNGSNSSNGSKKKATNSSKKRPAPSFPTFVAKKSKPNPSKSPKQQKTPAKKASGKTSPSPKKKGTKGSSKQNTASNKTTLSQKKGKGGSEKEKDDKSNQEKKSKEKSSSEPKTKAISPAKPPSNAGDEDDDETNIPPTVKKSTPRRRATKKKSTVTLKSSSEKDKEMDASEKANVDSAEKEATKAVKSTQKKRRRYSTKEIEELSRPVNHSDEKESEPKKSNLDSTEGASKMTEKSKPLQTKKRTSAKEVLRAIEQKTEAARASNKGIEEGMTKNDKPSAEKGTGGTDKDEKKSKGKLKSPKVEANEKRNSKNEEETSAKKKSKSNGENNLTNKKTEKMQWVKPGMSDAEKKEARRRQRAYYREQKKISESQ